MIRLQAAEHRFEVQRVLYGYEIRGFAEALQKLYETLEGSVRFSDWDGEPLLCFTVVNRHRGQIAVGGRIVPIVLDTKLSSEDRFVSETILGMLGIVVSFEGLGLDQSDLSGSLKQLQRFVSEHQKECASTGWCPFLPN